MRNYLLGMALMMACLLGNAQVALRWSATYNGQGDFTDVVSCAAKDAAGNVYLGGYTVQANANQDYWVAKLDVTGDTAWTWRMDWQGNGQDQITAIETDASGNVVVTGFAKSINTSSDIVTVKLSSSGDTLWTRAYNNPAGNEDDEASTIAIDANGNIAVAGFSDSDPTAVTNNDYVTLSYTSAGTLQWARTYNGLGSQSDKIAQVGIDALGNVVVTGRSNNGNDDDYVTIKYSSSGTQLWLRADDHGDTDRATCLAITAANDIYVSGRSDNGATDDFLTLKINSAGALTWARWYDNVDDDRALALVTDAAGGVCVTGQSDADATTVRNWDYRTVMYDALGTLVWTQSYGSPFAQSDIPSSIAIDASGNVYVTGNSVVTVTTTGTRNDVTTLSYSGGNQTWAATFGSPANLDDAANVVLPYGTGCLVAGYGSDATSQKDGLALNYDGSGSLTWEKHYAGAGDNNDNVNAIAVDATGNVFVAGYQVQENQDRNIALWKINNTGTTICNKAISGTSTPSTDASQGLGLDSLGNAYVGGFVKNSGQSFAMWWAKYSASCDTTSAHTYNTLNEGSDKIYDMVTDKQGNLYITGKVDGDATYLGVNDNCFTAKINPLGALVWSRSYASAGTNEDRGSRIMLSAAGNVYVVGKSLIGADYDIFLLKYDALGVQQWVQTYSGGLGNDEPSDLEVDAFDNVYIAGRTAQAMPGIYDYLTLKYAGATLAWAMTYGGTGNDQAQALAVDGLGNVFVTGRYDSDSTAAENLDILTLKYDASGALIWTNAQHGTADADDHADDIAVSATGNVYVTGHFNEGTVANSNYDIVTFILDGGGTILYSDFYVGSSNQDDIPNVLLLQGNEFYVGGYTVNGAQHKNMLLLSYGGSVGIQEAQNAPIFSVFPNPARDQVTVRCEQGSWKGAALQLHDATGRLVRAMTLDNDQETTISLADLASGLYIYQVMDKGKLIAHGKIAHP
jgi:uncharacterized delta-60 repeat protein